MCRKPTGSVAAGTAASQFSMSLLQRAACCALLCAVGGWGLRLDVPPNKDAAVAASLEAMEVKEDASDSETGLPYSMQDIIRILWDGYDIDYPFMAPLNRAPKKFVQVIDEKTYTLPDELISTTQPDLLILSPPDSGQSLLTEILEMNYMERLAKACGWGSWWVDHDRPWKGHLNCRVWGHGLVSSDTAAGEGAPALYKALENMDNEPLGNTVAIIVVKSPLATLESWRTAVWGKTPCVQRDVSEWDKPCYDDDVAFAEWGNRARGFQMKLKSTMDLYNRYMKMYHTLKSDAKFKRVEFIMYEDIVEDPADTVKTVADWMGWPEKGQILVPEGLPLGKSPGPGRPETLVELGDRRWAARIPLEAKKLWCAGLDHKLYEDLIENTHYQTLTQYPHVKYGFDCENL
eukprot:CAMPEP_0204530054 /NCGR_PEP_ID=MMETSP0661-20131031/10400_1 /ASSEMBLY_ACC=CAM_ASM_000606 /TAXON_ID=109239 /ORGANISM="Alexandrium margalefi, Strain AMGDE01CS-322" /LENGTH=403 /DNA_ID=CAMNT_0051536115 /DNA_START=89 /DNA_END=1300 /DNA_ORIENTATION=-